MTQEQAVMAVARDLATIAAPIYAENMALMRRSDALASAVRDAVALCGVAKTFLEGQV